MSKVALVTGTSTGIGLATSLNLARNGYSVFAGMRNLAKADALSDAAKAEGLPVQIVELDVTLQDSVDEAFATAEASGEVDVLVNNAGIGGATPLELTPEDEHRAMFETNYFGAVRCIQKVVANMRQRGSGTIVNVTSMEGRMAFPNQIPYSATKWALESVGEALAHELWRFGVRVVNIEPGVIMTSIFENSAPATRFDKRSPYMQIMRRNGKMFASGFKAATPPEAVADVILEAIHAREYKLRWPVGDDAFGMIEGRSQISDEDWVQMGDELSDEEYNGRFKAWFGIDL